MHKFQSDTIDGLRLLGPGRRGPVAARDDRRDGRDVPGGGVMMSCKCCGYDGTPSCGDPVAEMLAEGDRLIDALAASQREVERLRHGEATAEDGVCPDAVEVVKLRAEVADLKQRLSIHDDGMADAKEEVARCRNLIELLVTHAHWRDKDHREYIGDNADAIRYLAEAGRVEITTDHGTSVVARWLP